MEQRWHVGTWMVPSYDPELNLIYIGTSVTIPAPKFMLGGNDKQHLYHNSHAGARRRHRQDRLVLPAHRRSLGSRSSVRAAARRHRGRARSAARCTWINPRVKPGERRKVITGIPGKTGIVYTLDRADRRVPLGAADRDAERRQNDRRRDGQGHRQPRSRCSRTIDENGSSAPARNGGKNWPAGAYSPLTNTMYMPLQNMCMTATTTDRHSATRRRSTASAWSTSSRRAPTRVGTVWAISAETGKTMWKHEQRAGMMSLVATGGGLVFGGDVERPVQGVRRQDRQGAVGDEPRLAGQRLSRSRSPSAASSTSPVTTGPSLVAATSRRMTPELAADSGGARVVVFALTVAGRRMRAAWGGSGAATLVAAAAIAHASAAPADVDRHIAAAREAAGAEHAGMVDRLCPKSTPPVPGTAAPANAAAPPDPPRERWHAEPQKVFDNLYFVGMTEFASWAVTTTDGIIVIDPLFDYSVEDEVVGGLRKLGLDPADIRYVLDQPRSPRSRGRREAAPAALRRAAADERRRLGPASSATTRAGSRRAIS